jgi:hypothetical protein
VLASSLGIACPTAAEGVGRPLTGRGRVDVVAERRRDVVDVVEEEADGTFNREDAGGGCDSFEDVEIEESGRKERVVVLSRSVESGRVDRIPAVRFATTGAERVDSAVPVCLRRD